MVSYKQLINGLTKYIDAELINQLTGNSRILLGIGAGVALKKSESIYDSLRNNSLIKMLNIIDDTGLIDVETLYSEIKKQAERETINIDIPIIGVLSLNQNDIDKLYNYIINN